jgi:predicted nucleotidyltransferase
MIAAVASRKARSEQICRRFGVRRLELFGSAATDAFGSQRSDLGFLVDLGGAAAPARWRVALAAAPPGGGLPVPR